MAVVEYADGASDAGEQRAVHDQAWVSGQILQLRKTTLVCIKCATSPWQARLPTGCSRATTVGAAVNSRRSISALIPSASTVWPQITGRWIGVTAPR